MHLCGLKPIDAGDRLPPLTKDGSLSNLSRATMFEIEIKDNANLSGEIVGRDSESGFHSHIRTVVRGLVDPGHTLMMIGEKYLVATSNGLMASSGFIDLLDSLGDIRWSESGNLSGAQEGLGTGILLPKKVQAKGRPQQSAAFVKKLSETIEDFARLTSIVEVLPVKLLPMTEAEERIAVQRVDKQQFLAKLTFWIGQCSSRCQAKHALSQDPPPASLAAGEYNPLLATQVGPLLTQEMCQTIVNEAQIMGNWDQFHGDGAEQVTAICLRDLRVSQGLWEEGLGQDVRTRVAATFGLDPISVDTGPQDIFVCKFEEGHDDQLRSRKRVRGKRYPDKLEAAVKFSRSKSMVSFSVALDDRLSWAICFEERGVMLSPRSQGTGIIFSGKQRHAHLRLDPALNIFAPGSEAGSGNLVHSSPMILRGFARLTSPLLRGDLTLWKWGLPAWHLNSRWVGDRDMLDRAWLIDPSTVSTPNSLENSPGMPRLERANSTLAHRYFRQGVGGMDVPILDAMGRPLVDLHQEWSWPPWRREVVVLATLRPQRPWGRRKVVGRAGLRTTAGVSPRMDAALRELFDWKSVSGGFSLNRVEVPPIVFVFVDPRYRGLRLGRRLFLECMCILARKGFCFALITVQDNGAGGLFRFYEEMGFVMAEDQLGIPRAMIAPIPPSKEILERI
ncbi:unnamed protein product [Choristocarpus tenellus]